MGFFNPRKVEKSYDILGSFSWYVPGFAGIFSILGWFLVGMLVSMVIAVPMTLSGMQMCYVMLVIYPLQFMPVFIYSRIRSSRNATFERGYRLDSNHFGKKGGAALAVLAGVGMLAASLMLEVVNNFLPEMSEQLKTTMEMMTGGPLVPSLVCVGVFAPLFEEWMCRGLVLRGLLNYGKGRDGSSRNGKGVSPALAIVISALFFLTVTVAAMTSSVSLIEVGVAYLIEEKHLKRGWACLIVFLAVWVLGLVSVFSGKAFGLIDAFSSNFLLTVGALLAVLFVGWKMKKEDVLEEITNGGKVNSRIAPALYFLIRYIAPIAVLTIFISNFIL